MQNALAIMLQTIPDKTMQPVYVDNATIWHHMSDALHQSIYRVLTLLIAMLPGVLAFFVALTVFTLIGMAISALLRRVLTIAKFDDYLARTRGSADWTPATSPTAIVARGSFWAFILLGLIIGVSAFDASYDSRDPPHIASALSHPHCWRHFSTHRGHTDRAFPGAVSPDWSGQCTTPVRTLPFPRRQVAGTRPHCRHGSRPPRDRRRRCRVGIRHPLRWHCPHPLFSCWPGFPGPCQPLARKPCRSYC